jgi:hypothetical protein
MGRILELCGGPKGYLMVQVDEELLEVWRSGVVVEGQEEGNE